MSSSSGQRIQASMLGKFTIHTTHINTKRYYNGIVCSLCEKNNTHKHTVCVRCCTIYIIHFMSSIEIFIAALTFLLQTVYENSFQRRKTFKFCEWYSEDFVLFSSGFVSLHPIYPFISCIIASFAYQPYFIVFQQVRANLDQSHKGEYQDSKADSMKITKKQNEKLKRQIGIKNDIIPTFSKASVSDIEIKMESNQFVYFLLSTYDS